MSAAGWVHPEWLPAVAFALVLAAGAVAIARWRARRRRRRLAPALVPAEPAGADAALLVALLALGLALLGPRLGERVVRVPGSGVDLALLIDVSRSMDAADVPPSRLARAVRGAEEVLTRLAARDRVALAIFAGRGVLAAPLTPDHAALLQLLRGLDTSLIEPTSSDLGAGVRAATGAFEAGSQRPRVVLVISDGEDPELRGALGIAAAREAGARVLAAALGSDGGAPLPDRGSALRDRSGQVVVSRRRADRLERLAAATGGEVFRADRWGEFDFTAAAAAIRRDVARGAGTLVDRRVPAVHGLPLAALAFGLLWLEGLPGPRRRRGAPTLAVALLGGALAGASPPERDEPLTDALEARLAARRGDARLLVALGVEHLFRGRHEAAERAFLSAALVAREPELAATAYYDLGVSALERGDLELARGAFFDTLALAPDDDEARFNLEWTLAAREQRPDHEPAAAEPEPAPRAAPEPVSEAAGRESEPGPPAPLDPAESRRWLERVDDDPTHALRAAVGAEEQPRRQRRVPRW